MTGSTLLALFNHPLSWLIVGLALLCYSQLWRRILQATFGPPRMNKPSKVSAIIVTALPLLGLLGTIMGMQQSFASLVHSDSASITVTSGIRDALTTTLLGISLAIPGWLILWSARACEQKHYLTDSHKALGKKV